MRLVIGVLLSLALAAPARAQTQVDTSRAIITATGQARATITPDRAIISFLIEPQAMSVEEAASRITAVERAVLDTLRKLNLPGATIQSFNSGVAPYRSNMSPQMTPSFAGRSFVRVEVAKLDQVPALTAAGLARGATYVTPASFTATASDSVRRTLLPQALLAAQKDAEMLARAAGGHLGKLLDVNVSQSPTSFADTQAIFVSNVMYDNGQRATPTVNVVVNVTARWLLAH